MRTRSGASHLTISRSSCTSSTWSRRRSPRGGQRTCGRTSRTSSSSICASPTASSHTSTYPGSTLTRSAGRRWSAARRWSCSTTWSPRRRSASTTRASSPTAVSSGTRSRSPCASERSSSPPSPCRSRCDWSASTSSSAFARGSVRGPTATTGCASCASSTRLSARSRTTARRSTCPAEKTLQKSNTVGPARGPSRRTRCERENRIVERYVDPAAVVGDGTTIGRFTVLEADVTLGRDCRIGHNVVIRRGTTVGSSVRIDDNTVVGKLPMKAANSATTDGGTVPGAEIGDEAIIGSQVVIYAGCRIGRRVLVADLASIREDVTVGSYTIVGRGVTVENKCTIGRYCKLESESYITAYSEIGDRAFVAPQVATSNDNYVGRTEERFKHFKGVVVERGGRIGTGAVVMPGKTIGADALVAAGSVVTNDAPPRKIVMGCPARPLRDVPEEQLLENQGWEDEKDD
ncbi:MAG: hypothetical protein GF405_08165 [Candidatus Eisenbacteria bacterium]|nr:hypothetical protein [Candidatus Eisenbacteria bacterium]